MPKEPPKPSSRNATEIARETFGLLAKRRIAPTPDAYRTIYQEIAGIDANDTSDITTVTSIDTPDAQRVLAQFAKNVSALPTETSGLGYRLTRALEARDWNESEKALSDLTNKYLTQTAPAKSSPAVVVAKPNSVGTIASDGQQMRTLRELLVRTLTLAVAALLQGAPVLATDAEELAAAIKIADSDEAWQDISARLKQLCFKIDMKSADMAEQHELLLRLFRLLLENVGELLDDDSWLVGQIASVQEMLAGPITHNALRDATRNLKEVIFRQGTLKHSLNSAKITVKNMMLTFIDQLGAVAATTDEYHKKIDQYSKKISQATDINTLGHILEDVMRDTRSTQNEALRSRDEMLEARRQVQEAEAKVIDLEAQLKQMSELVREDQLTGSLNRRGLDDVFERESARADRHKSPICIAMLDLDDFKRLNDTHGHSAGDGALVHLVKVIKDTLRTMDVIARFGGEEFLILLPDTDMKQGLLAVTRIQRELTKQIFMHDNKHLLMTFSAGVALREPKEDQASLIKRADAALYRAKKEGKNRVIAAEPTNSNPNANS